MSDTLCEIKIKIKDFYPKLKKLHYNNYDFIISYQKEKFGIPLKDIENVTFKDRPEKINNDIIYNISLINTENKVVISNSYLVIPYIRLIQVIEIKNIIYEKQIKLVLEDEIKKLIFGPNISVGSIFFKLIIELNGSKSEVSNILISNNIKRKNKSIARFKNNSDFLGSVSTSNISKNSENRIKSYRQNSNYSIFKETNKKKNFYNNYTSINKVKIFELKSKSKPKKKLHTNKSAYVINNYYKKSGCGGCGENNNKEEKKMNSKLSHYENLSQKNFQNVCGCLSENLIKGKKEKKKNLEHKRVLSKTTKKMSNKNKEYEIKENKINRVGSTSSIDFDKTKEYKKQVTAKKSVNKIPRPNKREIYNEIENSIRKLKN